MIYTESAGALKQYNILEYSLDTPAKKKETLNGKTELTPPAGNVTEQRRDNTLGHACIHRSFGTLRSQPFLEAQVPFIFGRMLFPEAQRARKWFLQSTQRAPMVSNSSLQTF